MLQSDGHKSSLEHDRIRHSVQKQNGAPDFCPVLLAWYPPQVLCQQFNYCSTVKAWQAAVVVTGTLPAAPGSNRRTPSSFEQKLRTPDWLKVTGEAAAV